MGFSEAVRQCRSDKTKGFYQRTGNGGMPVPEDTGIPFFHSDEADTAHRISRLCSLTKRISAVLDDVLIELGLHVLQALLGSLVGAVGVAFGKGGQIGSPVGGELAVEGGGEIAVVGDIAGTLDGGQSLDD